eukprot:1514876-Pleurochrysis_carterae.AAC.1
MHARRAHAPRSALRTRLPIRTHCVEAGGARYSAATRGGHRRACRAKRIATTAVGTKASAASHATDETSTTSNKSKARPSRRGSDRG